jgi:hypothetical protein
MDGGLWWRRPGEGKQLTAIAAWVCFLSRSQPRWGWHVPRAFTQGSSRLATLGFAAKSLWDFFADMSNLGPR